MAEENPMLSDNSDSDEVTPELRGILSKWTNYIHGWQDRFIVLKDSTLSYYKSELESNLGCRGALSLKKATVKPHEFDDCRFDVSVNDCVWYLRASSPEEKQQWIDVLETFRQPESGYGTGSESSVGPISNTLRRQGSLTSLHSTGSTDKGWKRLGEKVCEVEALCEQLGAQSRLLQRYWAQCCPDPQLEHAEAIDAVKLADGGCMSLRGHEVAAASASFEATCAAAVRALTGAVTMLRQRHHELDLYQSLKGQLQDAKAESPKTEESPLSVALPDDEFFDAVENSGAGALGGAVAAGKEAREELRDGQHLPPPHVDHKLTLHPLWPEIDRITKEQIEAAFAGVGGEIGWQLFAEDGDMRMYRREEEVDGMVMDPLKAIHKVRGVSARELCHYFFTPLYRYDWETTLEQMTVVETMSRDAAMFYQTFKRIWPTSQRDALFWSHVRRHAPTPHTYAVVNHSTHHPHYPANQGACIRLFVTVCLACRTTCPEGEVPRRDNITTSIAYCSTVNPGGWAPAAALRAVYKREYPKFLKCFTHYVTEQCRNKPLAL